MNWRVAVSVVAISLFATLPASARNIRFTVAKTKATGIDHTGRVAVGDFNHDGNPDLAISSTYNQVAIFLGKGNGTFTGPTIYNLTFYVTGSVAIGDFNNDGKLDLAVVGGDTQATDSPSSQARGMACSILQSTFQPRWPEALSLPSLLT